MITLQCSLSEKQIKAGFRKIIFGSSRIKCPKCGNLKIRKINKRYWCNHCRKFFSLTSTTWLKGIRFSWKTLYLLLHCWLRGYSVKITQELVGLSRPTISYWFRKFRTHIPQNHVYLSEEVEVDESWFGVRNKGRKGHTWKENKIPVAGIYARQSDLLVTKTLVKATKKYIIPFVKENINPKGSHIFSDMYRPYWPLPKLGFRHTMVDHYNKEYTETNHLEGCWSVIKRKLKATYYAVSKKRFPEYVCEMTYRFNTRKNPDNPLSYLQKSLPSAS